MNNIIWYRSSVMEPAELLAAKKFFPCYTNLIKIGKLEDQPDIIIPRYSILPFFKETIECIDELGKPKLINSARQHYFAANLGNWYSVLEKFTAKTWFNLEDIPNDTQALIVKGETNSRKFDWNTHCFAKNKNAAHDVYWRLCKDALIIGSDQSLVIREYVPLRTFMLGINDLPISNEYRFFVCNGKILSGGYYWSNYIDDLPEKPNIEDVPLDFINEIISKIGNNCNFYTLDIAEKANGGWILIEINDGQMSGLSENDPMTLYENLYNSL